MPAQRQGRARRDSPRSSRAAKQPQRPQHWIFGEDQAVRRGVSCHGEVIYAGDSGETSVPSDALSGMSDSSKDRANIRSPPGPIMSLQVALLHRTTYRYDRRVSLGPQTVRLRPAPHCRTPILAYSQTVTPGDHFVNVLQDPAGNFLNRYVFHKPTTDFTITVDLIAEMAVINPFDFFVEAQAEHYPFRYDPLLAEELAPFRKLLPPGPRLAAWLDSVKRDGTPRTIDFLVGLNTRLEREIDYIVRMEPGVYAPDETLARGEGSCRDSAWLFVQILRHLGFAARFVSGYLIQLVPDVKPLDGPAGPTTDFTDLHAWTEVYLPGAGWIGLDPTSGLLAGEGHIPLAATPDPASAAPVTGTVDKAEVTFDFEMSVTRVFETPRVTKPYDTATWNRIMAAGAAVDRRLAAGDVRLTMGGEPTFVSIDDMEGDEWTTDALGPTKRKLAGQLLRRLAARFAQCPLLHYGQGKWYPGEQLPRWGLGCYWRPDGEPVWKDPALLAADEDHDPALLGDGGARAAQRFIAALADGLGLDSAYAQPGYEDAWYYLWRERRLPDNVDPLQSNLADPLERERLAKVFRQGLNQIVGYVLPLRRNQDSHGPRWLTGPWFLREETLYLTPGNHAMGYRLPLDSLPWVRAAEMPYHWQTDPLDDRPALPPRAEITDRLRRQTHRPRDAVLGRDALGRATPLSAGQQLTPPADQESAPWIARTALCVEPRDGILYVFMPPTHAVEDYLELITAIEDTAARLGQKVMIEGYDPPADPRLRHFTITPAPGVLEVNIQPAATWAELVETTEILYGEARATRLGTEKFNLDGKHVGTGGGNHVVIGGPTAADSPLLRRPRLLQSLITYWQHHPSLSYLFSGQFIGPTSQHPRVDEARHEGLYELELAFTQIPEQGDLPPWEVDRLFRNLLIDVTGNTHRTELCIDKLYSPDGPAGRRGLLELRPFEMPPHAHMSAAQMLLLRALVARLWDDPYDHRLVRWGTRLHDDFMLPHYVWRDFEDVIDDLNRAGIALDSDWFRPHFEFRFPEIGSVTRRDIGIELRSALEPWHVLGEYAAAGGMTRYVDSALERLQVRVEGLVDGRHVLACNGQAVPLRPTGTQGEYVAGIRYRAWQPWRSLHPTIPVDNPLVFDLFDRWNGRSAGGCTYHVSHPGGLAFEAFPINASEAESRRRARFFAINHSPGTMPEPGALASAESPRTLDLRFAHSRR